MPQRKLNEQGFCVWCGASVNYTDAWVSKCTECGYKNYINPKPAVTILLRHNDSFLFVRRGINPKKGQFDLPGGFVDMTDETIEAACYRELDEELGVKSTDITIPRYVSSGIETYDWMGVDLQILCSFFYADLLVDPASILLDKQENSELLWVKKDQLADFNYAWDLDKKMVMQYLEDNRGKE